MDTFWGVRTQKTRPVLATIPGCILERIREKYMKWIDAALVSIVTKMN